MSALLVVTDLDGTLLDHHDYSFDAARPCLDIIRRRHIPLVLCSSKTRVEMEGLQRQLALRDPFICENGAAICTPSSDGTSVEALAPPRGEVLSVLSALRDEQGFRFTGFNDLGMAEIAALTGLSLEAAGLAASREYSEPLRWEDSEERKREFLEALQQQRLVAQQGGRFLSVAGPCDKGMALSALRKRYAGDATVIALGDSPNDESMLAAADIAVIIRSARSESLAPEGPQRIVCTRQAGPSGWQEAMSVLLEEFQ